MSVSGRNPTGISGSMAFTAARTDGALLATSASDVFTTNVWLK